MTISFTARRHAVLFDRMANALGIDLEQRSMEGQLEIDTLENAVLNCSGCTDPAGCEHWLATRNGTVREAPGICRNHDLFDLLKEGRRV